MGAYAKLGKFLFSFTRSEAGFALAKQVFTSEDLWTAGIRAADELGDNAKVFIERLAYHSSTIGNIGTAQDIVTLMGKVSGNTLDYFKQLDAAQLDLAVENLTKVIRFGDINPAQLQKLLENNTLFTAAYDRGKLLSDASFLSEADGFNKLVNSLAAATNDGFAKGRLYELQSAANILNDNPGAQVTFLSKYVKETDPNTGAFLSSTDIDFILNDGVNTIYYQAKTTTAAFGHSTVAAQRNARHWISLAQRDAADNGITNQIIKYVVPSQSLVPQTVLVLFDELEDITIEIIESPLLR